MNTSKQRTIGANSVLNSTTVVTRINLQSLFVVVFLFLLLSAGTCTTGSSNSSIIVDEERTTIQTDTDNINHENTDEYKRAQQQQNYCTLYLANSTIPGAGLGLFAGNRTYNVGDIVTTPDVMVPLLDMNWHNNAPDGFWSTSDFLWDEYTWSADDFDGLTEFGKDINSASFGYGAIPNSLQAIVNCYDKSGTVNDNPDFFLVDNNDDTDTTHPSTDTTNQHNNPGYGAYTTFHNRSGIAKTIIPAGQEIFINYGSDYFTDRGEFYDSIPLRATFATVDILLKSFNKTLHQLIFSNNTCTNNTCTDIYTDTCTSTDTTGSTCNDTTANISIPNRKHPFENDTMLIIQNHTLTDIVFECMKMILEVYPSRVTTAVPKTVDQIWYIQQQLNGTSSRMYDERSTRDVKWLHDNGLCMDTLYVADSAIPYAGRGAFAKYFIPNNSIIAPVPLVHIPNRSVFNMYSGSIISKSHHNKYQRNVSNIIHYQLLLNYCYGHRHSTLLLCPYGVASSSINNAPTNPVGTTADRPLLAANAKVQWSTKLLRRPEWLNQTIDEWAYHYYSGLSFEYVATRNIQPNEEVLIDYGTEWQDAWDTHIKQWSTTQQHLQLSSNYKMDDHSTSRLHQQIRTMNRQLSTYIINSTSSKNNNKSDVDLAPLSLPINVHLWCRNMYPYFHKMVIVSPKILKRMFEHKPVTKAIYPCRIINKSSGASSTDVDSQYTVELLLRLHGYGDALQEDEDYDDKDYYKYYGTEDEIEIARTKDDEFLSTLQQKYTKNDVCYEVPIGIFFQMTLSNFVYGTVLSWDDAYISRPYNNIYSFRHDLRIPDTIMPKKWKNLPIELYK